MYKNLISLALGALLLQACSPSPESPVQVGSKDSHAQGVAWNTPDGASMDALFAQAQASNKPVFLYWGAVWCPPCNQVKATVFSRPDFIARSQQVIPVYLDGDTRGAQKLGAAFKVKGYPTMIVLRPDRTELTRLPGEVDAQRYIEALDLAIHSGVAIKTLLDQALGAQSAQLPPQAWRQLAYYAWDQDEAQLAADHATVETLLKLADHCPADQSASATRLSLKAVVASTQYHSPLPDPQALLTLTGQVLADAQRTRDSFDILLNYSDVIAGAITRPGTPARQALIAQWDLAMDRLQQDASLSTADRLGAVYAKVSLAKMDLPAGAAPHLDSALLEQVRRSVAQADQNSTTPYERQSVIPSAAELLSDAGLLDASDALLQAELPRAASPYYDMLVLSSNAKARGDKAAALDWSEKAWNTSVGPATRLQWGVGYVSSLLELSPQDQGRIERAALGVVTELEPVPETFYERNQRGLQKLAQRLQAWNKHGQHTQTLKKVSDQLASVCDKLPPKDDARSACMATFQPARAQAKS